MERLPSEVIREALLFSTLEDHIAVIQASKRLRLIGDDPYTWKKRFEIEFPENHSNASSIHRCNVMEADLEVNLGMSYFKSLYRYHFEKFLSPVRLIVQNEFPMLHFLVYRSHLQEVLSSNHSMALFQDSGHVKKISVSLEKWPRWYKVFHKHRLKFLQLLKLRHLLYSLLKVSLLLFFALLIQNIRSRWYTFPLFKDLSKTSYLISKELSRDVTFWMIFVCTMYGTNYEMKSRGNLSESFFGDKSTLKLLFINNCLHSFIHGVEFLYLGTFIMYHLLSVFDLFFNIVAGSVCMFFFACAIKKLLSADSDRSTMVFTIGSFLSAFIFLSSIKPVRIVLYLIAPVLQESVFHGVELGIDSDFQDLFLLASVLVLYLRAVRSLFLYIKEGFSHYFSLWVAICETTLGLGMVWISLKYGLGIMLVMEVLRESLWMVFDCIVYLKTQQKTRK